MQARNILTALVLLVGIACGSPDPDQTGFVLLDEEARAAGIGVETDGERHEGALPIAVDAAETAAVVGPHVDQELRVAPGEVVEVRGAEGRIVRGFETDRLVVDASESGANLLAEMLGAPAHRRHDGRWELNAPNVLLIASMFDPYEMGPEVRGASVLEPSGWVLGDPSGASAQGLPTARLGGPRVEAPALGVDPAAVPLGTPIDPASVVGVYRAGRVTMIFDAAGGYRTNLDTAEVQHGVWRVSGSAVFLVPADGSGPVRIGVTDTSIYDATGAELSAATGSAS